MPRFRGLTESMMSILRSDAWQTQSLISAQIVYPPDFIARERVSFSGGNRCLAGRLNGMSKSGKIDKRKNADGLYEYRLNCKSIVETETLSNEEKKELKKHESVIERNVDCFLEIGNSLKCIRESKLYRDSHKTFETYVKERWKFARPHAYRLINAADVKANLSPMGDKPEQVGTIKTERQMRELINLSSESLEMVINRAVEISDGGDLTASILKKARTEILNPPIPTREEAMDETSELDESLCLEETLAPEESITCDASDIASDCLVAFQKTELRLQTLKAIIADLKPHEYKWLQDIVKA